MYSCLLKAPHYILLHCSLNIRHPKKICAGADEKQITLIPHKCSKKN